MGASTKNSNDSPALELTGLKKAYTAPDGTSLAVVDVPSFTVLPGQQTALTGSSGSGKTTFLHLIAGILTPDSGQVIHRPVGGVATDITRLPESARDVFRGRHIGYIFQTHHLLPGFTALENVLLGMSFTGRRADRAWAQHLLEAVGLKDRLHYRPAKLSVGQQQRVAVARAMSAKPSLVLADEPTGALDVDNANAVLALIRKLCDDVSASLLLVTHDPDIAMSMPSQVALHEINRAARKPVSEMAFAGP